MTEAEQKLTDVANQLQVVMTCKFVPWSKSRKAEADAPSLNFEITLSRKGHTMKVPYTMGHGHCRADFVPGGIKKAINHKMIEMECETGLAYRETHSGIAANIARGHHPGPSIADVLHSLTLDADVLDHPSFEAWAATYGYDADSRKAEALHKECIKTALAFRAVIGNAGIELLRDAGQDY